LIKIASDEEIPFKQDELQLHGASIECRINAEDPYHDFAPSVGVVPNCNLPYGPGVRVDTYLYPGCTVSGYYDSLVAKLVVWGQDFNEARMRMLGAIDEFIIEGISTTLPLYKTIMNEENFVNGNISTEYLEKFELIRRMADDARSNIGKLADSSVAAALIQTEFLRKSEPGSTNQHLPTRLPVWNRTVEL
jgi:acetyl-CoA/propionyl-CoA carboxylase